MLDLDHAGESIKETFKLDDTQYKIAEEFINDVVWKASKPSRLLEHIWFQESLTDNQRVLLLFTIGRYYEQLRASNLWKKKGETDAGI